MGAGFRKEGGWGIWFWVKVNSKGNAFTYMCATFVPLLFLFFLNFWVTKKRDPGHQNPSPLAPGMYSITNGTCFYP